MSQVNLSRLTRALRQQSPQHPAARRKAAEVTTRDLHPTRGSKAILQAAAASSGSVKQVLSLNVRREDGSQGRAFCWGILGFGWGGGEWPGGSGEEPLAAVADQGYPDVAAAPVVPPPGPGAVADQGFPDVPVTPV